MHKDVYEYLKEKGINCDYDKESDNIKLFFEIEDVIYELSMKFPRYYPYEFPEIFIKDTKELTIPHLYTNNKLCLYDINEVLPSPEKKLEDALDCVIRAKNLLIQSNKEENMLDYQIETVSFWETKANGRVEFLGDDNFSTHLMWKYEWIADYYFVGESQEKIVEFINNSYGIKPEDMSFGRALFVNIGSQLLMHINQIKDVQALIPKSELKQFYDFLYKNSNGGLVILYADNGLGKCLFSLEISLLTNGIKVSRKTIKGILATNNNRAFKHLKTRNYQIQRLFTRGGDGKVHFDKKCLLIGCGSVGSFLSKTLIDIGITKDITLMDNDYLQIENLARHLCGSNHLCLPTAKVEALKLDLLKHYPTIKCSSIFENAWEYILNNQAVLNNFNLILICVGNTLIEKKIIQLLKEKQIKQECIILWVEPYLVAGHALVFRGEINENTEKNLFDANGMFKNNVLIDSRKYLKSEAGCQSAYAPYAGFEVQKFVLDFTDIYYRKIYKQEVKCNYEFTWLGKMQWARRENLDIKSQWRAKEDRYIELKRIDN